MRRCRNIFKHGAPTGELLFDVYGIGIAGFSFRKLSNDYEGYCLKVRRSSDDTLQDIGFTNDFIDTVSLLEFIGSGSGYVHTWYNQGSENANFVQTTNSKQPRIVNSGNIEADGGKPCMRFLGGQVLSAGNNFGGEYPTYNEWFSATVAKIDSTDNENTIWAKSILAGQGNRASILQSSAFLGDTKTYGLAGVSTFFGATTINTRAIYNYEWLLAKNYYLTRNNSVIASALNIGTWGSSNYRFLLGAFNDSSDTGEVLYLNGTMQEHIIYKTTTIGGLPNTSDLNTDIINYYGIT